MVLDALDQRLLALLGEDARRSYRTLAKIAESTVPTVSARIRRMEDLGVILGYRVQLSSDAVPEQTGLPAAVKCHQCDRMTNEPIEATLGGRRHAFCCPTCKGMFEEKYNRMRQA